MRITRSARSVCKADYVEKCWPFVNSYWWLFKIIIARSARSVCKAGYCLNEGTCTVAIIAPGIPIIAFIDWMFCQESTSQFVPVQKDSKGLAASSNTCRQPFQARQLHYYHFAKLINISSRLHRCHNCMPFICRSDSDLNLVDHHKVRFPSIQDISIFTISQRYINIYNITKIFQYPQHPAQLLLLQAPPSWGSDGRSNTVSCAKWEGFGKAWTIFGQAWTTKYQQQRSAAIKQDGQIW